MRTAIILFVLLALTLAFVKSERRPVNHRRLHVRDDGNGTSGGGNGTSTTPTPSGGGGNGTTPTPSGGGNGTTPTPSGGGNGTTPTPSGGGNGTSSGNSSGAGTPQEKQLFYMGGPEMTNPIGIHFIFYGGDDSFYETLKTNFKAFISDGFGKSAYYAITNTQLLDSTGTGPSTDITWAGEWKVPKEQYGTSITVQDDSFLVTEYANSTGITLNSNDHYMIFIGDGVTFTSGDFKDTCGYHTSGKLPDGSGSYVYSLVSSTASSNNGGSCAPLNGPFGPQVDGSIATAVHEIIEAASDPGIDGKDAWRCKKFGQPNENADNCEAYENQQPLASDSSKAWNIQVGQGFYLIVGNWDNQALKCVNPLN